MNLIDRNTELRKASAIKAQIEKAETRLTEIDDEDGTLKDELAGSRAGVPGPESDW